MLDRIRVGVVDDHPIFRQGVIATLRGTTDMDVVGEGESADAALRIATHDVPDIILLDVNMPGGGIQAAVDIQRMCPAVRTVMLTVSESEEDVTAALQVGVNAYVLKGSSGPELLHIIRTVTNSGSYITPSLAARLLAQAKQPQVDTRKQTDVDALSDRESQILHQVSRGLKNREIAVNLQLTEKTVKHYMTELMKKLNVRNRVEAVLVARDTGHGMTGKFLPNRQLER